MPGLRDNADTRRIEIMWCSQPSCSRWEGSAERLAPPRRGRKGMDWALSGISLAILLWWRAKTSKPRPRLQALRAWSLGLPERAAVVTDGDAVIKHRARWTVERDAFDDEIDGSVIKLDDLKDRERLGAIAHHSRWAMAYKFEPRREVTEKGGHSDGERRDRPRAQ